MKLQGRLAGKQLGARLVLAVVFLSAACRGPTWEEDPDVRAARIACAGLRAHEHYTCVEDQATTRLNPDICHLAVAGLDGLCLQAVYEAADDPSICDHIFLKEMTDRCRDWYAWPGARPRLREERRLPSAERVAECAAETARQEAAFRDALTGARRSFVALCQELGPPDWETGEGMIVFVYELDSGGEVRLGFERLDRLSSAYLITANGQQIDMLPDQ